MAGSDKKVQKRETSELAAGSAGTLFVTPPDVAHLVLAGLPTGLIPRAKLDTNQTTTIKTWPGGFEPGETEYWRLEYAREGSEEWHRLDEKSFTGGDTWVALDFTIPTSFMLDTVNEGSFKLRYEHENWVGEKDWSQPVVIHIDKVPPNGTYPPVKMGFTVTPPITDETFGADDFIEATIPLWDGDTADVQVAFGWIKGELPEKPGDIDLIGPVAIAPGGKVQIPKAKFIEAGDGKCCGGYVLIDKAGNMSALSLYELISVALGPLPPKPLPKPTAADATGGDLLREDILNGGVYLNVPKVGNGKRQDTIVVKWKDQEIIPGTPIGDNPPSGTEIFVPWSIISSAYGNATGVVATPLSYTVLRGIEPFPSDAGTVNCNLSSTGPINPDPEPGNPALKEVSIMGQSGTANKLVDSDQTDDVFAHIELVAPLAESDSYQVMWNGKAIGDPYVIKLADDTAGEIIDIKLDWDVIRGEGPSTTMPVWYVLSNPAHKNPQEPKVRTSVEVGIVIKLPEALPQNTNANGYVTCSSLRWNTAGTEHGIEYLIPPDRLTAGDDVDVEWNGYTDFANPVLVPATNKKYTFANISQADAENGIVWLIAPYAAHILPVWSKEKPSGVGEVKYTIKGKPDEASPTKTRVVLSQGEGSCNIPAKP